MDDQGFEAPSSDMNAFKECLRSSKHLIAVAGAGLSAASGIPTFRGAGGLWRKFDATSLATPEAFYKSPNRVWQFYHYRREVVKKATINKAHEALAAFSLQETRNRLMPDNKGSSFTLITQNIDGLSLQALERQMMGRDNVPAWSQFNGEHSSQPPLYEMHGRLFEVICTDKKCGHVALNTESPVCPALAGTEVDGAGTQIEKVIPLEELPRCGKCGSLARPGVVWFGETPRHLDEIQTLVDRADLCVVVGTSSTVYPAAGYAAEVQNQGGKVAVFNLERSEADEEADFLFLGPCEETLPRALGLN